MHTDNSKKLKYDSIKQDPKFIISKSELNGISYKLSHWNDQLWIMTQSWGAPTKNYKIRGSPSNFNAPTRGQN